MRQLSIARTLADEQPDTEKSLADIIGARRNLITIKEFATLLCIAPSTIYDMAKDGRLPTVRSLGR